MEKNRSARLCHLAGKPQALTAQRLSPENDGRTPRPSKVPGHTFNKVRGYLFQPGPCQKRHPTLYLEGLKIMGKHQMGDKAPCGLMVTLSKGPSGIPCGHHRPHMARKGCRQGFNGHGQGRIKGTVIRGVLADEIDNGAPGPSRVVKIGNAVGIPRPQVKQGQPRHTCHAGIPVRRTCGNPLERTQNRPHTLHTVKGLHKGHLRGARVGKTISYSSGSRRTDYKICCSHHSLPAGGE